MIRNVDVIHVIENGRIIESGDWKRVASPGSAKHKMRCRKQMT
jgi:hypothetical protein